jgi:Protein of unknown function (DUF1800)
LLWRAGFGPKPGQAAAVARKGLSRAVDELVNPPKSRLIGPRPTDDDGAPLAPRDAWGHDHLWWLDRMVRSNRPLVERMTLVWHDWFATSNAGVASQKWMLHQNDFMRRHALGSFETLLLGLTKDPAMLIWLNGRDNTKWSPNENYARELMELFTLGAGRGYTEDDVREQARALTGWRNDWREGLGDVNFRYDPARHDTGVKVVFGKRGNFDWQGAARLCIRHPLHASFFVRKLWSYFIPVPPPAATQQALVRLYRQQDFMGEAGYHGHPQASAALHRPADGEAADRHGRGHAPREATTGRHGLVELDRPARRPAPLPPAQRGRLERRPLAGHVDVPRTMDRRQLRGHALRARPRLVAREASARRGRPRRPGARLLGTPDYQLVVARSPAWVRAGGARRRRRELEARRVPRPDRQRPAAARRRVSRLPDLLT